MRKSIKKAVLIAGGYSTRMLPFTRRIPKELLPLRGIPIIQVLLNECIAAGIEDVIVITRPDNTLLKDHFSENPQYHRYLEKHNKSDFYNIYNYVIPRNVNVRFVQEDESLPYGDALGLLMLRDEMMNEDKFLVLFADDLILNPTSSSVSKLIAHAEKSNSVITLSVAQKSSEEMLHFGNVFLADKTSGQVSHIVRKPKPGEVQTNLAMCGQSVLSNIIFEYYDKFDYSTYNELDTAITISRVAQDYPVDSIEVDGHWVTVGNPKGYLEANIASHILNGDISKQDLIEYINKI